MTPPSGRKPGGSGSGSGKGSGSGSRGSRHAKKTGPTKGSGPRFATP